MHIILTICGLYLWGLFARLGDVWLHTYEGPKNRKKKRVKCQSTKNWDNFCFYVGWHSGRREKSTCCAALLFNRRTWVSERTRAHKKNNTQSLPWKQNYRVVSPVAVGRYLKQNSIISWNGHNKLKQHLQIRKTDINSTTHNKETPSKTCASGDSQDEWWKVNTNNSQPHRANE